MRPQEIEKRNLKVVLPPRIYNNIFLIFQICLESIKKDLITPLSVQSQTLKPIVHQLLRLMLFTKLFVRDAGLNSSIYDENSDNLNESFSGRNNFVSKLRILQKDLSNSEIWQLNKIWLEITKIYME